MSADAAHVPHDISGSPLRAETAADGEQERRVDQFPETVQIPGPYQARPQVLSLPRVQLQGRAKRRDLLAAYRCHGFLS